jgi:uncharacterized protein (DUF433 family)
MEDLVWSDPETVHGTPVFKGSRVPLQIMFDYLEDDTLDEFVYQHPTVEREQAAATLEYIKKRIIEYIYASTSRRVATTRA